MIAGSPLLQDFRFSLPKPSNYEFNVVFNLIDDSRCWKVPLHHSLFSNVEVNVICSLPLSIRRPPDNSVYHVAQKWILDRANGASSFDPHFSLAKTWKKL